MKDQDLKAYLDQKAETYNCPDFIPEDPISIPHRFSLPQDIEISGLLTAVISWGNRKAILKSAEKILDIMGNNPFDFVRNHQRRDLEFLEEQSVHRTFNGQDLIFFFNSLQEIYKKHKSLEDLFLLKPGETDFYFALERFRTEFLKSDPLFRTQKHLSSPKKNASAKRLMMFLRWMVRKDRKGVDFGIWKRLNPAYLSIPLDVHTGNVARQLEMISRKQNDWKTVQELDRVVRKLDPRDPARYDFALFGIGVHHDLD